ncbi:hypothetical protein BS47DRAFT_1361568 [Hydnum rufescens UP504]|uniref:Uncharacterized protein n=1 Tax=Hydnum rufescens UP504 TaxID=1448309 RepID=A0A9P6AZ60_9AGAM|nr:hypothetical protein BS47DRAFT_1361568 [Hydnum rufescens UP504]
MPHNDKTLRRKNKDETPHRPLERINHDTKTTNARTNENREHPLDGRPNGAQAPGCGHTSHTPAAARFFVLPRCLGRSVFRHSMKRMENRKAVEWVANSYIMRGRIGLICDKYLKHRTVQTVMCMPTPYNSVVRSYSMLIMLYSALVSLQYATYTIESSLEVSEECVRVLNTYQGFKEGKGNGKSSDRRQPRLQPTFSGKQRHESNECHVDEPFYNLENKSKSGQ